MVVSLFSMESAQTINQRLKELIEEPVFWLYVVNGIRIFRGWGTLRNGVVSLPTLVLSFAWVSFLAFYLFIYVPWLQKAK